VESKVTCEFVHDRLEGFASGTLSDTEFLQIMKHVDHCRDCAVLLRMQQHTNAIPHSELEAQVPESFVDTMYGRVMETVEEKAQGSSWLSRLWPKQESLVPALAAAIVVLVVGGGMMFNELRTLQQKERRLAARIERQERVTRSSVAGSFDEGLRLPAQNLRRVLTRHEDMSVEELLIVLRQLPPEITILDPEETANLLDRFDRRFGDQWKEALGEIEPRDGLQIEEMLRIIRSLDPDPYSRIPTMRLLSLSNQVGDRSRSFIDRRVF
jgi:hypothetical protein